MQGHLVTITSQEERNFITDTFHSVLRNGLFAKTIWLGGFQDTDAAGVLDGWNWVTGEAWGGYTEWASGQPNNLDQNYLAWAYLSTSPARGWHDTPVDYKFWADEPVAYIVEYEAVPVPASFLLLGAGLCVIARLKHE